MANQNTNTSLFDVDEKAQSKPTAWFKKGPIYDKKVVPSIRAYEQKVDDMLGPMGVNPLEGDLELLRAFNNGIDYITKAYAEDSKAFNANKADIIEAATSELNYAASNRNVSRAVDTKLSTTPVPIPLPSPMKISLSAADETMIENLMKKYPTQSRANIINAARAQGHIK